MKIIYNKKLKLNMFEIDFIKWWFDEYYTEHEQKLRRLHTLNQLTDDNKVPYDELLNLYVEAEIKRKRLQELEANIDV